MGDLIDEHNKKIEQMNENMKDIIARDKKDFKAFMENRGKGKDLNKKTLPMRKYDKNGFF